MLGQLDPRLQDEFPELSLHWRTASFEYPETRGDVARRLQGLAARVNGRSAVMLRTRPEVQAMRSFYRWLGLDPDDRPPPAELAIRRRIERGGFATSFAVDDALVLAAVETGVSVWAADLDRIPSAEPPELSVDGGGQIRLNGGVAFPGMLYDEATRRVVLYTLALPAISRIAVEEALFIAAEALAPAASGWSESAPNRPGAR